MHTHLLTGGVREKDLPYLHWQIVYSTYNVLYFMNACVCVCILYFTAILWSTSIYKNRNILTINFTAYNGMDLMILKTNLVLHLWIMINYTIQLKENPGGKNDLFLLYSSIRYQ